MRREHDPRVNALDVLEAELGADRGCIYGSAGDLTGWIGLRKRRCREARDRHHTGHRYPEKPSGARPLA
jgi:hypothetical protein